MTYFSYLSLKFEVANYDVLYFRKLHDTNTAYTGGYNVRHLPVCVCRAMEGLGRMGEGDAASSCLCVHARRRLTCVQWKRLHC